MFAFAESTAPGRRVYDRVVPGLYDQIAIVPAREASLEDLNRLIVRSKAYWEWPEEYLSRATALHRITPAYLSSNRCFEVIARHAELLGFLSLTEANGRVVIDNLWIEPQHIRRRIGTAAVHFAFELARACGWPHLWVVPDPPAEGFYRALGFSDTGERVPSRVSGGPVFSVYRISTPEPPEGA
jgi:GNAT superfamily N-acetyltransferase